jgi:hypothetical protein
MLNISTWVTKALKRVKREHRQKNRQIKMAVGKVLGRKVKIISRTDNEVRLAVVG